MECGFYQFEDAQTRERFGSFEIYEIEPGDAEVRTGREAGFYWWACSPGCLPDGEPYGPFGDATEAYEDALEYGYC